MGEKDEHWEYVFSPRSIAIVGVSSRPDSIVNEFVLYPLIQFGYRGKIYPINPNSPEIQGIKAYPSISDVPAKIDYVICAISCTATPQLMRECVAKGVKVVHLFTAGFADYSTEGRALEKELVRIAEEGGIRMLGPNCMGVYHPRMGISYCDKFPKDSGPVALICQSGGESREITTMAALRGVRFSKVVSYGNAADLNECDFLDYFAGDNHTKIVLILIEATREGHRFHRLLAKATKLKPVVILKTGRGEAGKRAALSHTGKIGGTEAAWDAVCKQTGAIKVVDEEELIDLALTLRYMSAPAGRRVCVFGIGGGANVLAADECERAGLDVQPLPSELAEQLKKVTPGVWSSLRNPVEPPSFYLTSDPNNLCNIIECLTNSRLFDSFIFQFPAYLGQAKAAAEDERIWGILSALIKGKQATDIPMAMVWHRRGCPESMILELQNKCLSAGIPCYGSVFHAANSINKFAEWRSRLAQNSDRIR